MKKDDEKIKDGLIRFGQELQRQRKALGFTQKELTTLLQLSQRVLSGYETGKIAPQLDFLLRLPNVGFDLPNLLFEDEQNGVYVLEGHEQTFLDLYRQTNDATRLQVLGLLTGMSKQESNNNQNISMIAGDKAKQSIKIKK